MSFALATVLSLDPLPVGFRFRPTDQELVDHYLRQKINGKDVEVGVINNIDVNKKEPWDWQFESAIQTRDSEWFFFSRRDRKHPNADCFNRATTAGYWKQTGEVRKIKLRGNVIGTKKTLVFRAKPDVDIDHAPGGDSSRGGQPVVDFAPNRSLTSTMLPGGTAPGGDSSRWVMHEYEITLEGLDYTHPGQDEFVLCRLFDKSNETLTGSTSDAAEPVVALATAALSLNSLPVGFRFRPTDQELVDHYLRQKINGKDVEVGVINNIDVNKKEPWDWHCYSAIRTKDPEWFFFSQRHRKYPNRNRFNRATKAGYWKPTGKDRYIKSGGNVIGMKKTLVFYKNRDHEGGKTPWVMHEYRTTLEGPNGTHLGQDAFVLCRLFDKSDDKNEEAWLNSVINDCGEP